jgi:hypothetical protein
MTAAGSPSFVTVPRHQQRSLDMRILGLLFLVFLLLAVVGYFRGWFTVTSAHAGSGVTLHVDEGRMRDDSRAAVAGIADTSAKIAEVVKSIGRRSPAGETVVDGTVTAVDTIERDLTVRADTTTTATPSLRLRVPDAVKISRDGDRVAFGEILPGARVKLTFVDATADRRLEHIEVLR